jgi:hypothetical protein
MAMLQILNLDCTKVPLTDLGAVVVMVCDPPYSRYVHANAMSVRAPTAGQGVVDRDFGFGHLTYPLRRWIAGAAARVRRWSLIYSDVESTNVWRHSCEAAGAEYVRSLAWVRWSQPQLSGNMPPTALEMIGVYHAREGRKKRRKAWNGPGNLVALEHVEPANDNDVPDVPVALHHKSLRGKDKHRAEKPLDQALDLVSYFTEPGELVFDPTCGVGTFGLACRLLGRDFVGIELNSDVAAVACARLVRPLSDRDKERALRFVESRDADPATLTNPALVRWWKRQDDKTLAAKGLALCGTESK